uniref:Uncharacterized protein n=2 Tax=environmental samples TaxID=651140 RepID=A0A075H686_9ARCH|nr:hypothetical protein [uncultured marine thaumarchaeote KM3_52_F05]AIF11571.1 hypothetical protein [uncultured marine thaumarchaeote KM3_52_H04]
MYRFLSILTVLIIISTVPLVSSEVIRGESTVPDWVKNTAGWWASEQISDAAFLQGIQYLIKEGIMIVEIPTEIDSEAAEEVPGWVKNTAGWWSEDKIHDVTFVSGIQYLISKGIIVVEQEVEESVEEVVEIKDFYMEVNGGSCCFNWAYVGEEYRFQIETQESQHGKYIDGVKISVKIISKGGELRYDFGEVTTEDGVYKNSIIIPSMDWYAGNILSVTGEYFGVEKTIVKEFEVFKNKGGTSQTYGAGAGGCALVGPVDVNPTDVENQPQGLAFSKSGEIMFVVGSQADQVLEYDLTNAYCMGNVSTPIMYGLTGDSGIGTPTGIAFDSSGTKMFITDKNQDDVFQFDLDEPWKVSSASYTATFVIADQEKAPTGIVFDSSGTKMFIVGADGTDKGEVNVYELTVPYILTSASHVAVYTMSITSAAPAGIAFDSSGTKMFIVDSGTDSIREYALNVPYITSSNSTGDSNTPSLSVTAVAGSPRDIWFDASGTKLFVLSRSGSAQEVTVYELTVPFVLSSATIVS